MKTLDMAFKHHFALRRLMSIILDPSLIFQSTFL
jgi:hypothetical protein